MELLLGLNRYKWKLMEKLWVLIRCHVSVAVYSDIMSAL